MTREPHMRMIPENTYNNLVAVARISARVVVLLDECQDPSDEDLDNLELLLSNLGIAAEIPDKQEDT